MATRPDTIPPILDAIPGASARKMFGEYGLYLDGKIIGGVHDDVLHLKAVPEAAELLPGAEVRSPYPGAKPHLVAHPWLDDPETLAAAARAIAAALPAPKTKR